MAAPQGAFWTSGAGNVGVATTPTFVAAGERRADPLDLAALERVI